MSVNTSAPLSAGLNLNLSQESLIPERKKIYGLLYFSLWVIIAAYPVFDGFNYYYASLAERAYSPLHDMYKPSGLVGQGLGIIGALMILVGVASYMLRKRWRFLHRFGKLRSWLTFHIFLCTLGPFLVLLHTTFKFGNIASISFWSMAVVVASGIFGRYVYVRIPKTINGQFLSAKIIEQAQTNLIQRLSTATELPADYLQSLTQTAQPSKQILKAVAQSITFGMRKPSIKHTFESRLKEKGLSEDLRKLAVPLLMNNAQLQLRAQVMQPFIRAFGYWHAFHIPLSLVMLVTLLVHIGVAIAFGYTWIF